MRKTLINKFKTFAMLSAFVILFSSCDDSTSANEENSALKKEIAGNWLIFRTIVEENKVKEFNGDYRGIGFKDTMMFPIAFSKTNENVIIIGDEHENAIGEWKTSSTYNTPHWVAEDIDISNNTNVKYITNIEITAINPLKGIMMLSIEDSLTKAHKLVKKAEITGKKIPVQYSSK